MTEALVTNEGEISGSFTILFIHLFGCVLVALQVVL